MVLIFIDAVSVGVQVELPNVLTTDIVVGKLFLNFVDSFTMIVFSTEIVLKWIDNFFTFWRNGWNVFDFGITVLVCVCMCACVCCLYICVLCVYVCAVCVMCVCCVYVCAVCIMCVCCVYV